MWESEHMSKVWLALGWSVTGAALTQQLSEQWELHYKAENLLMLLSEHPPSKSSSVPCLGAWEWSREVNTA